MGRVDPTALADPPKQARSVPELGYARVALAVGFLCVAVGPTDRGLAQPATAPAGGMPPVPTSTAETEGGPPSSAAPANPTIAATPAPDPYQRRADQLRQLMDGSLSAEVDERTLLALDLEQLPSSAAAPLLSLLEHGVTAPAAAAAPDSPGSSEPAGPATTDTAREPAPSQAAAEPSAATGGDASAAGDDLQGLPAPLRAFVLSVRTWAALSPVERATRMAAHRQKREAHTAEAKAQKARDRTLAALQKQAQELRALLAGKLPHEVDPEPLLRIDLADWPGLAAPPSLARAAADTSDAQKAPAEPAPNKRANRWAKQKRKPAPPPEPEPKPAPAPMVDPDPELSAARAELLGLRMRLLQLTPEARAQLLSDHEGRKQAAKQDKVVVARQEATQAEQAARVAAEARQVALRKAEQARTEAQRVIAAEHARLLGIEEQQARFEATLAEHTAAANERRSVAVEWGLKVRAIENRSVLDGPRSAEADRIYEDLRLDLRGIRFRLNEVLDAIERGDSQVPRVGEEASLPADGETKVLVDLRKKLVAHQALLDRKERAQRWQEASGLHEDMENLNRARLNLLAWLSPPMRARYTGSGPEAVRQAQAEVQQIILELRTRALALPREARALADDLSTSPLPVIWGFLKFVMLLALFRTWRRRAGSWLGAARRRMLSVSPPTQVSSQLATLLWYLLRIRRPLELLVMVAVVVGLFGQTGQALGLDYVWLVAAWGLSGSTVVRYLDAVAARQHLRVGGNDSAALRIRSLRLLGILVVGTGLLLSLFKISVGRGTIYEWVWDGCWLLMIPTGALLIRWWRPTVLERIEARTEKTPFFEWVRAHKRGPRSYLGAAAGGIYLLSEGLSSWLMTEAGEWEVTRRLLAYLFRTEAARRAEARGDRDQGVPIDELRGRTIYPMQTDAVLIESIADEGLKELVAAIEAKSCTLAVVSGERGVGKSVLLHRLASHFGEGSLELQCPPAGFSGLLRVMRTTLELEQGASDEDLVKAINARAPKVVIVDDLQRAIRPAIGGLSPLDRLVSMARDTDANIAWVLSIGSPAWNYVARARSERIAFDRVVSLKGWSEEQIGQLLRANNDTAGIHPSFEGLVVTRQMEDANEETTGRAERGYYRILWDYSGGNPAVALYWWRKSLHETAGGEIAVRLFRPPDPWDLETVPLHVRFTLRAILQLDWAHPNQLVESLEMSLSQVDETLRFAQARGYLESEGKRVRIAWPWLRAITVALKRQHLITG